ncbi:UNVERIFIED_CONTAM: hypothetical protein GTU68_043695, partial [Idotea baltica]|nr:hypothetical protein [Idotea baltica]
ITHLFKLISNFNPAGDQPQAIKQLVEGINNGEGAQVLLGVTGSGKTFTMANVIAQVNKPTLILSHNKTLVAQLYGEFTQFFPDNAVEYYVSYYDYYQPESYLPVTGTYIEKDLSINDEVEKLRLRASTSLLSGRRDVVVLASVSCIFGMGNPADFKNNIIRVSVGTMVSRNQFLFALVSSLYSRTETEFERGNFRVRGDTVDIFLPYAERAVRVVFFGDEVEELEYIEPSSGKTIEKISDIAIFPASIYTTAQDQMGQIINQIQDDLAKQVKYFEEEEKFTEAKRLKERTEFDLEMIRELGYCSGIENYSRYLDRRKPGERPFCLLDYFPDDFLLIIDESHQSLPQVRAMYGGDRARKINLVEYGFRLPAALDNRPLNYQEFEDLAKQTIYVSATPSDYELEKTGGVVVEQIVRPTGLLDPIIDVRPSLNQVDDLIGEINERVNRNERILVTTLTKRMAEELTKYFTKLNIDTRYIHSEVDTMERVEILRDLRLGEFSVLVGVNLLREGLDLPEVSLVAILDADKEGFLRNDKSLIQTSGRAARNANGYVIMYADRITASMKRVLDDNTYKRKKQMDYNLEHDITPTTVYKTDDEIRKQSAVLDIRKDTPGKPELEKTLATSKKRMVQAAKKEDFLAAAKFRDEMFELEKMLKEKFS